MTDRPTEGDRTDHLGWILLALGAATMITALLGPLAFDLIRYHASDEAINQVIGGDAVALVLVGPVAIVAGGLTLRRHPAGPVLAIGPALYMLYTSTQLAIGGDFLRYQGTGARFFPLFVTLFLVAAYVAIAALRVVGRWRLPMASRRTEIGFAVFLLVVALFLAGGLHLPGLVDAWRDEPLRTDYLSDPALFWLVKFMDLAIVVPSMVTIALGLLRRAPWATLGLYAAVAWFALLGSAVAGMAVMMQVRGDPNATIANVVAFGSFAAIALGVAVALHRPLFDRR